MTKRMLIDATHAEETRVVVLDGNRLEDFDVETSTKRQIKGNIYLAKIVRVEPSLQAAFVEYGGNRHGFLAFDEIHPDYYQIPVADRQRLLAMEAEEARREQEEDDRAAERSAAAPLSTAETAAPPPEADAETIAPLAEGGTSAADTVTGLGEPAAHVPGGVALPPVETSPAEPGTISADVAPDDLSSDAATPHAAADVAPEPAVEAAADEFAPIAGVSLPGAGAQAAEGAAPQAAAAEGAAGSDDSETTAGETTTGETTDGKTTDGKTTDGKTGGPAQPLAIRHARRDGEPVPEAAEGDVEAEESDQIPEEPPPETLGGENDTTDEPRTRRIPSRLLRNYKIQEVIHRRQILLVQVEKEERGTKGAALTTYISLAGRYCVLMPNSPRGGGISRKITAPADRRRLKEVMTELDLPEGMGLIVRTAGANRPKPEIKRDAEYLLRLWDDIREQTLKSVAPALIYEEASLIKRAIRDVYSRDIDEITVDGEAAWRAARDFMRMLMPSHAKKVQLWHDPNLPPGAPPGTAGQPLFARHQVDAQLDGMLSPTVQLRSGGYLVINQAEALVAIDVNSGRSTRERGIEETALRTNLEAADEVARQLRLRDLAGLIVIDFIDMESRKHNAMVEKRMKEALKADRARIQLGHISHFGLMEMSRQRLRPSLAETSLVVCAHCGGTGHVRSTESAAIHVLRAIEEEGGKRRAGEILVHAALPIVLYILNHKRDRLGEIEARHGLRVAFAGDDQLIPPQIRIEKLRPYAAPEAAATITAETARPAPALPAPEAEEEAEADEIEPAEAPPAAETAGPAEDQPHRAAPAATEAEDEERRRRRRRRRRRGGRREEGQATTGPEGTTEAVAEVAAEMVAPGTEAGAESPGAPEGGSEEETAGGPETAPEPVIALVSTEVEADIAFPAAAPAEAEPTHIEGVPEHAEPEAADDAEARARRRGRRGGRRRRREDETLPSIAAPGAEQPDLPVYAGPTPANPFGGQMFDIFDVLEQAEARAIAPAPVAAAPPAAPLAAAPAPRVAVVASEEAVAPASVPAPAEAWPEPAGAVAPETAETAPEATVAPEPAEVREPAVAPEPVAVPVVHPAEPTVAEAPAPADLLSAVATPEPEPAIKPIVIGAEPEPPAEKKRGWWRRPG